MAPLSAPRSRIAAALACALALLAAEAAAYDPGENAATIVASDLADPAAPRFEQHPAAQPAARKPAGVDLGSHPEARLWRTRLREGAQAGPNFAGRYTVVAWGCGTDCTHIALVDSASGAVHFPAALRSLAWVNVADKVERDGVLRFRQDSNLLVAVGMPNEDPAQRGVSYYVWTGTDLSLIYLTRRHWYR